MAARQQTAKQDSKWITVKPGVEFSIAESELEVKTASVGRSVSPLTEAYRGAVELAAKTRKTYTTPVKWGTDGKLDKAGNAMVSAMQKAGRDFGVSIRFGSDHATGKKVAGSSVIFCAVDQIKRPRKAKADTNGETPSA